MALGITGKQFVKIADSQAYTISGIPAGYTLSNVMMPNAWSLPTIAAISAGSQVLTFTVGIGSGTLGVSYINSGVTITIYYDVYTGATRMGEELKQDGCVLIPSSATPIVPPVITGVTRCTFMLDVFADIVNTTIDFNNDKSDFYYYGSAAISTVSITLQKLVANVWTDQTTFTDQTYGKFFAFGNAPDFSGNAFVDDYGKRYTGIFLNWLTVLQNLGSGIYRIKSIYTDIFSVATTFYSNSQYNLMQYNTTRINGTIRIESFNQGLRGDLNNPAIQIDYFTGWQSQIRLRGLFLYTGSSYNKEYNQYGDADFNVFKPIIMEQSSKYSLTKLNVPAWLVWYITTNISQADIILISDYNTINRFALLKTPVMIDGDFTIDANNLTDPLGDDAVAIALNFIFAQNSLRKRNS